MSSSSSEEENLDLLKEAIATDFISDDLYQQNNKTKKPTEQPKLPSLRRNDDDYDKQFDNLGVTTGFQQHVAKHLVGMLDRSLKDKIEVCAKEYKAKKRKGGIKLFSDSNCCIKKVKEEFSPVNKKIIKEVDEIDFEKNAKCVAINPDDIFSKKDTLNWSNRSKAKIFHYKSNKNGVLNEVQ